MCFKPQQSFSVSSAQLFYYLSTSQRTLRDSHASIWFYCIKIKRGSKLIDTTTSSQSAQSKGTIIKREDGEKTNVKKITQRNDMKIFSLKFFFLVKNEERDGNTERWHWERQWPCKWTHEQSWHRHRKKKEKKTIRDFSFFLFSLTRSSWRRSIKTSGLGGGWECTRHQSVHNDIQIYIKCVIRPQCTNI